MSKNNYNWRDGYSKVVVDGDGQLGPDPDRVVTFDIPVDPEAGNHGPQHTHKGVAKINWGAYGPKQ